MDTVKLSAERRGGDCLKTTLELVNTTIHSGGNQYDIQGIEENSIKNKFSYSLRGG